MIQFQGFRSFLITLPLLYALGGTSLWAMDEGMPNMPKLSSKKVSTVPSTEAGETLVEQRGFGDEEPKVRMMNLMMVGGSGYEGMDMGEMQMADNSKTAPNPHADHAAMTNMSNPKEQKSTYEISLTPVKSPIQVGANLFEINVQATGGARPPKGLAASVEVYMTSMDMGTEHPKVREVSPGKFQTKAIFSMQGPWAIKVMLPGGAQKVFPVQAVSK